MACSRQEIGRYHGHSCEAAGLAPPPTGASGTLARLLLIAALMTIVLTGCAGPPSRRSSAPSTPPPPSAHPGAHLHQEIAVERQPGSVGQTDWREETLKIASKSGPEGTRVEFVGEWTMGGDLRLEEYRLHNGMVILLVEDPRTPLFAYQTWFRVGSGDEEPGRTGMAHLFEHMMFRGTELVPEGSLDKVLEANGAVSNAATWLDWTQYQATMPAGPAVMPADIPPLFANAPPKDRLETVVRLEAERMVNLVIDEEALEAEREVVKNERRYRVDDDPEGLMFEVLYETALQRHPYRWPTIGYLEDIESISLQDCLDFYGRHYSPRNATLVVVGNFQTRSLLSLVSRYYGSIGEDRASAPEGETTASRLERPLAFEPAQNTERRAELQLPIASERLVAGFRIPPLDSPDYAPIVVLNELLTGGEGSVLHHLLVQQSGVASEVDGMVSAFRQLGVYELVVVVRDGQQPGHALSLLDQELEKVMEVPFDDAAVSRAVNRLEISHWRQLSDADELATHLGHFHATTDSHQGALKLVEEYRQVTPDDIVRVARTHLSLNNRTVVTAFAREQ